MSKGAAAVSRAMKKLTKDSYQNFLSHVGRGTGNQNDGSAYGFNPITRNRLQLEYAYRGSWICGQAVDTYAEDMTREGVAITSDDPPEKIQEFEKYIKAIRVWKGLEGTAKWARLYGGGIGFLMIKDQNAATPLDIERVGKDQFKGIMPMDRWMLNPSLDNLVNEYGPDYGKPVFYDTLLDSTFGGVPQLKVHYSRCVRMEGVELPYFQKISENMWGQSVIERLWDRMIAFDSTTTGAAQLVYKAHLRTIKIKGLRKLIAMGGDNLKALLAHLNMVRTMQTNEGLTTLDGDDEFEANSYAFSGLDALLLQFGQQLSGAIGIPLVRLFGQSPAGLNSTGESDLRNYHEGIKGKQEDVLGPAVEKIYHVAYRSYFGKAPPTSFALSFRPLYLLTEEQKGAVGEGDTRAAAEAYDKGIVGRTQALRELRARSRETGRWASITDEDIKKAEDIEKKAEAGAPSPQELGLSGLPGAGAVKQTEKVPGADDPEDGGKPPQPKKAVNDSINQAAGVMLSTPEGKVLLMRRAAGKDHPGEWAFPAGHLEAGETAEAAARREFCEETGADLDSSVELRPHTRSYNGIDFSTFAADATGEFQPQLNEEHDDARWVDPAQALDSLQLHPGAALALRHALVTQH